MEGIRDGQRVGAGELGGRGARGGGRGDGGGDVGEAVDDGLSVSGGLWGGGGARGHTTHGPRPRSIRGALKTLNWLAGAIRDWHLVVRLLRVAMTLAVGLGWAMPRPPAAMVERTVRRMVMVEDPRRWFCAGW